MPVEVVCVPVLSDNYAWLVHEEESGRTAVVDPSVAEPVLEAAAARNWSINEVWNTHWHDDHIGGNAGLRTFGRAKIIAPSAELHRIGPVDVAVDGSTQMPFGSHTVHVIEIPGHTLGHVAYYLPDGPILFSGDTMFAMGCGRILEGTAEQMFTSLRTLSSLPPETLVYCAHEYTETNGNFALSCEQDNHDIAARVLDVRLARSKGLATVPTTVALELATNPFVRATSPAELAARRAAKDHFGG